MILEMGMTILIMINVLMITMMMMMTMMMMLIAAVTRLGMLIYIFMNIITMTKFQYKMDNRFVQNRSHRSLFQENLIAHIILQLLR